MSILNNGIRTSKNSTGIWGSLSGQESQRVIAKDQLEAAEDGMKKQAIGTGAGIGAAVAASTVSAAGGIGAMSAGAMATGIGAPIGIGMAAAWALTELM